MLWTCENVDTLTGRVTESWSWQREGEDPTASASREGTPRRWSRFRYSVFDLPWRQRTFKPMWAREVQMLLSSYDMLASVGPKQLVIALSMC